MATMPDFENQHNSYEGRQVPMDLDAERCLLGSILRDPDVMGNAIMIIKDESFFYLEKHQLIWTALCTLNRNYVDTLKFLHSKGVMHEAVLILHSPLHVLSPN